MDVDTILRLYCTGYTILYCATMLLLYYTGYTMLLLLYYTGCPGSQHQIQSGSLNVLLAKWKVHITISSALFSQRNLRERLLSDGTSNFA